MKYAAKLTTVSTLALLVAAPAFALDPTGVGALNDRIDAITEAAQEDIAKGDDEERFGPLGVPQGWRGSMALTTSTTSGNTNNGELSLAGRLTYGVDVWSHTIGFAAEFARTGGVETERKFFGVYEADRYFTDTVYGFGTVRYQHDVFATNKHDAFLGVGVGARIVNTDNMTWRVQAGPGARYIQDNLGVETTEVAGLVSSRFWYGLTDTISITNDTDILGSKTGALATNDLGLNFAMSDNVSTRISYRTEYNSDPLPGLFTTDNTLGMSLVVGF